MLELKKNNESSYGSSWFGMFKQEVFLEQLPCAIMNQQPASHILYQYCLRLALA